MSLYRNGQGMTQHSLIFRSVGRTHQGLVRKLNEDVFLERPDIGLWMVADGMGGHNKGDVAASMIAEVFGHIKGGAGAPALAEAVRNTIDTQNLTLYTMGASLGADRTMGAAVVSLIMADGAWCCHWVGDSRAYRYADGRLTQLTRDHSLVQEMVDAGKLTAEEAEGHPMRNVITRAVGADRTINIASLSGDVTVGDRFLVCTDGVTTMCDDDDIAAILGEADLDIVADQLVDAVLKRGARDNLSFVLVDVAAG